MQAIVQRELGPPEVLVPEELPDPVPGPGQLGIAVGAAGVHLVDTSIRAGKTGGPFPRSDLPMVPGREVAGVVDAIGPGVEEAWLGRRVVAHLGPASGGYAERAVRDVAAAHVLADHLSDAAAVAMIGTGRTAMAVLDAAQLTCGDVVLVTAAAGGIGHLVVQEATALGAAVVGVAGGPAKVARVAGLGVVGIDHTEAGWDDAVRAALGDRAPSVVIDSVGGDVGRRALGLLSPGGRIVLVGWSSGTPTPLSAEDLFARSLSATAAIGPGLAQRPGGLRPLEERALAAATSGRWVPWVQPFPLSEAAAAHRALEDRRTTGKVVLVP